MQSFNSQIESEDFFQKKGVVLKPGKEKAILHKHHWIFSGAVQSSPSFKDGEFLPVYASNSNLLGSAYFNRKSNIIGRMVAFDATPPLKAIQHALDRAIAFRKTLFNFEKTNAYRLVNGEGDGLPGLVIDIYDNVAVMQLSTKGMDGLKPWLVEYIDKAFKPLAIYEKSLLPTRREEGLVDVQGVLKGTVPEFISIKENGLSFQVNLEKGQKTGFFLDHREMREWIRSLADGKRILNAFSYTGGFGVYALAGGAKHVDSVDISEEAIDLAKKNTTLNGFSAKEQGFHTTDVFQYLRENELNYELVILDPPAFAKKQKDIIPACRGYKDINRIAMQKMPSQSLLLTCSCSHHVDESLFQKVVFQAAFEAKRSVRIIGRHRLAQDHPINVFHPEGEYLKSLLLYID
ncbi:MAG: class I SAM-dependent rRNA methyltransferase [Parachlamydiaceae bacterium]|nr:class I SAM-dependent rRNA methyltransferase [Parachlamydiaceae bacterium]